MDRYSPSTEEDKLSEGNAGLIVDDLSTGFQFLAGFSNATRYEVRESRMRALEDIMEALIDPNIYMMGLCRKDDSDMVFLLDSVTRRARRDNLFDVIVMVSIRGKPNLRRIQEEIADELGFSFQGQGQEKKTAFCAFANSNKAVTKKARQLSDWIRTKQKILFILGNLQTGLDLPKLGIPFGVDHQGCKLIQTSESEEILSNHMNAQRTFRV